MIEFVRFVIVLLVVWYGIRLIIKYVLPWLIMRFIKKQQENFDDFQRQGNNSREDEVNINKRESETRKNGDELFGEYVDFEEIEPDQDHKDE